MERIIPRFSSVFRLRHRRGRRHILNGQTIGQRLLLEHSYGGGMEIGGRQGFDARSNHDHGAGEVREAAAVIKWLKSRAEGHKMELQLHCLNTCFCFFPLPFAILQNERHGVLA